MFTEIDLAQAARSEWDVIVAGSSFAAQFFQLGLPPDLRVLIIEKGQHVSWDAQLNEDARPAEDIRVENASPRRKTFTAHTLFGGNSNCWWGQVPRFHPNDFKLQSLYGVGEDWPFGYDELEPYYSDVEQIMQIAGGGTDHIFPRSKPLPYPPHALSLTDKILTDWRPDIWVPVSTARANGGDRATCCANGICDLCPIDAKFRIENSVETFNRDTVRLVMGAECRAVEVSAGRADAMIVRAGDEEVRLKASVIALGTNALYNAAILLRSGLGGDAVGRYLHEQDSVTLTMDIDKKNYFGGSTITTHCFAGYDGPHRSEAGAVLIENFNAPTFLRQDRGRWTEVLRLRIIAEDIPQADNRVLLDDNDMPYIDWVGFTDYAEKGIARGEAMLPDIVPFTIERITKRKIAHSEAHIQGTHRMGSDPATSVVDDQSRVHGIPNLFALGSGVFPSCSPANPTLTLSALALRAGRSIT